MLAWNVERNEEEIQAACLCSKEWSSVKPPGDSWSHAAPRAISRNVPLQAELTEQLENYSVIKEHSCRWQQPAEGTEYTLDELPVCFNVL